MPAPQDVSAAYLADEDAGVRLAAQGQELDELPRAEREANAVCDDRGLLAAA